MLTDIFAYRYLEQKIWTQVSDVEKRLLNQAFGIVKDALPYYTAEGKEHEKNKANWKMLHDQLSRELGVDELSPRYYSFKQKNAMGIDLPVSGWFDWTHVCGQYVNAAFTAQTDPDRFIKERLCGSAAKCAAVFAIA